MVCLSPVGYGVELTFRALALRRSSHKQTDRQIDRWTDNQTDSRECWLG